MHPSASIEIKCWTQICDKKSQCEAKCTESNKIDDSINYLEENIILKETTIRLSIEDPQVSQHGTERFIRTDENSLNNIIGD